MTRRWVRASAVGAALLLVGLVAGCACSSSVARERTFSFDRDTLAYRNELRWKYAFDAEGRASVEKADPPPEYSLRCFPMVRLAREFFYHARFHPSAPKTNDLGYALLVREIARRNSRCVSRATERIVIPGFHDLHEFSDVYPDLLKQACGGPWRSFLQRGNWRMVLPITARGERKTAEGLVAELKEGGLPIVHVYRFPNTTLNHALLLYGFEREGDTLRFRAYDPNDPSHPAELSFDRSSGTFFLGRNQYFAGGAVKVYEVYRGLFY